MGNVAKNNKSSRINRLLIVGHEMSNYETVESLLNQSGMKEAEALRKEKVNAKDVSSIIKKANNIDEQSYDRLEVNPIWNGLAMDLMISNMDNKLWGWSDPQAISLLEYWKSADPNLGFVLVYNSPINYMGRAISGDLSARPQEYLRDKLSEYARYNEALLDFYYHNIERTVLVSSEQVFYDEKDCMKRLEQDLSITNVSFSNVLAKRDEVREVNEGLDIVSKYLIKDLVSQHQKVRDVFEELQSVANLPFEHSDFIEDIKDEKCIFDILMYRKKDIEEKNILQESAVKLKLDKESLQQKIQDVVLEKNQLEALKEQNIRRIELLAEESVKLEKQKDDALKKSEISLEQSEQYMRNLFEVQEEFEKVFMEREKISVDRDSLKKYKNNLENDLARIAVEKDNFVKKNEELVNKEKSLLNENKQLMQNLFEAQKELDKLYSKRQEQAEEMQGNYGAADRVRDCLSYRLGTVIMNNYNSFLGCVKMPFKLLAETRKFKKDQKNKPKLPPLSTYVDYCDAERLKKHLTYHLGKEILESFRTPLGLITWPFAIIRAVNKYKRGEIGA